MLQKTFSHNTDTNTQKANKTKIQAKLKQTAVKQTNSNNITQTKKNKA